jgi:hypothetical protein
MKGRYYVGLAAVAVVVSATAAMLSPAPHRLTILVDGARAANVPVTWFPNAETRYTDATGTIVCERHTGTHGAVLISAAGADRLLPFPPPGNTTVDLRAGRVRTTTVDYELGFLRRERTSESEELPDATQ